jgi:integrase
VDWDAGEIRVVQKGNRPHAIPITRAIAAILSRCCNHHPEFVFTYVARRASRTGVQRVRGQRYPVTYEGMKTERARACARLELEIRFPTSLPADACSSASAEAPPSR